MGVAEMSSSCPLPVPLLVLFLRFQRFFQNPKFSLKIGKSKLTKMPFSAPRNILKKAPVHQSS